MLLLVVGIVPQPAIARQLPHPHRTFPGDTPAIFPGQKANSNPFEGITVGTDSVPSFADLDSDGDLDAFIGEKMHISITSRTRAV